MKRNHLLVDRLSLLPDETICHILSFLPTKDAVVTSFLSKRYRYLFAFVPIIDLDFDHFGERELRNWCGDALLRLTKFVNKMLTSKLRINKFRIQYMLADHTSRSLANSWILEAIKRNVEMLDIGDKSYYMYCIPVCLPNEIFHCRTLVSLKLFINGPIKVPEHVDLPNLKELSLRFEKFVGPDMIIESLHNLFPGCPVLEDLRIDLLIYDDFLRGVHVIYISIPSLKSLKLDLHWKSTQIIVDTPNLLHFDYTSKVYSLIEMKNLNCLVNAHIAMSSSKSLSSVIAGISHVKSLSIKVFFRPDWFFADCSFPKFSVLKNLKIYADISDFHESLFVMLYSMPALEFLDMDYEQHGRTDMEFQVPPNTPMCFSQCLKEVAFRNFYGHKKDFELVKYILQHGKALTRMIFRPSKEPDPSVRHKLLALTMSSKICQIDCV